MVKFNAGTGDQMPDPRFVLDCRLWGAPSSDQNTSGNPPRLLICKGGGIVTGRVKETILLDTLPYGLETIT